MQKVKQSRECSLLFEYKNGNVTTTLKVCKVLKSEARAPTTDSKSLAEITKKKKVEKKLSKLLAYHKRLVDEKGLSPSNLLLQHSAESSSSSPPAKKARQEDHSAFKCDFCENFLKPSGH